MKIIPAITTKKIFDPFDTVISRQYVEKDRGKMQQRPAILLMHKFNESPH